jgi:UDP-glucose 4-epimerase
MTQQMYQKILVTGGAGFIGGYVVDELVQRGYSVVVLDNLSSGSLQYMNPQADFIQGDVRNRADVHTAFSRGIDAVIHIAGQASIKLSFMDPYNDLETNTLGTVNIIQACIEYGVERLLYASSMTIYGTPKIVPTTEDSPIAPVSYYAVTKYAGERYVHIAPNHPGLKKPLNVTSLRMFNVYGPRQSLSNPYQGVLAIFIGRVLRNEPIIIHSDGEQSRDFVYVTDVARVWSDALENPNTFGKVLNVGTGKPVSVNKLCDWVLQACNKSRNDFSVQYAPAQPGDIRHSIADISQIQNILNWSPQVDMEELGILATVKWATQQGK